MAEKFPDLVWIVCNVDDFNPFDDAEVVTDTRFFRNGKEHPIRLEGNKFHTPDTMLAWFTTLTRPQPSLTETLGG